MAKEKIKIPQRLKIIIAVLLALLILSLGALTVRIIYLNLTGDKSTTTVVPDNLIGEEPATSTAAPDSSDNDNPTESRPSAPAASSGSANAEKEATVIALYKGHPRDNEKFQAENMFPGDLEVKYFAVKVSHHADAAVYFNAKVTEQTKNLADVLHIKVTHLENGKVIYDGAFADMNSDGCGETFAARQKTETVAYYKIEVLLPATAGNEHQAAKLIADFHWTVKDAEVLDPPQTGDNGNVLLYFIVLCCALAMIIILLLFRRREKEDKYAEAN